MSKIAIIGSGPVGLHLGFGFLAKGYKDVTIYSDRTGLEYAQGKLTQTAAYFTKVQEKEKELGIDFWPEAPHGAGFYIEVRDPSGQVLSTINGNFKGGIYTEGVDYRIKIPKWMDEFQSRGGKFEINPVDIGRLEQIAEENDLVFVAVGKGSLASIFEKDPERSNFRGSLRRAAIAFLEGPRMLGSNSWPGVPYHGRLTTVIDVGDFFSLPMLGYSGVPGAPGIPGRGYAWEAVPGSRFDVFEGVTSGEDLLARGLELIEKYAPEDMPYMEGVKLSDPKGWLYGSITPIVRKPIASLPSGKKVMAIGDVLMLTDPLAGQGGNNNIKFAHHVIDKIVKDHITKTDPFWYTNVFEDYFESDGKYPLLFTDLLMGEPPAALMTVMAAASQSQGIADELATNFGEAKRCWPWIVDQDEANKFVEKYMAAAAV